MKVNLYDVKGSKKGQVELPAVFSTKVREDIAAKYFEADKFKQPYGHYEEAGKRHSASGTISHRRHEWKGHYGKGVSRVPRKAMWRRGVQFGWIGAEVSGTRGGRRAHGPKGIGAEKKLNKKEVRIAMSSAFAATANSEMISKRYNGLKVTAPWVVESQLDGMKSKDLFVMLDKILGDGMKVALKKKKIRAGKGTARGRKYKSNAGMLLVKARSEKVKSAGIEVKSVGDVKIKDLYPLGRIVVYTEKALEEMK